ncbi:uncharacterized protein LOC135463086 [Liolophura sinensis]|uniref:uncharacterized protein LOC135463086 n=1 Tax=Liolophura sinensis TaxID=3198878 RepID=UPI0031588B9C
MFSTLRVNVLAILICASILDTDGHGYLYDPPSRSSLWRHGYNVEPNFDDNALYCGGREVQWGWNGGKCGVCGDRFDGPRHNEAGGKYATGIISRNYAQGGVIPITVKLTAPHAGWFEFRICPNNDITKAVTQECLDKYLLGLARNPDETRFNNVTKGGIFPKGEIYNLEYRLPASLTCAQCVLQWRYNAGNDWGCVEGTNICAVGLGPQEQFYGCADIAILPRSGSTLPTRSTTKTTDRTKAPTIKITTSTTKSTRPPTTSKSTTMTKATPTTNRATTTSKSTTTTKVTPTTNRVTTTLKSTTRMTTKMTTKPTPTTLKTSIATTSSASAKPTTTTKSNQRPLCRGAGIFRGTVMDNRCVYMCQMGTCPDIFCTDACRELYPNAV